MYESIAIDTVSFLINHRKRSVDDFKDITVLRIIHNMSTQRK